jgi:glycerate kinase
MSGVRVLVAPDKFKGTFSAAQVAAAIGRGLERAGAPPPDLCPIADGGDGTLAVLLTALGGETAGTEAIDALGSPLRAGFALIEDRGTAIVEVAEASGLSRIPPEKRDPVRASTYGTGQVIAAAVSTGAQVVLVAAGGSATTDGGSGAIEAIEEHGGLRGTKLVVLCDVRTPFEQAAIRFAPQKGADPATVARLNDRLEQRARELPKNPRGVPMTGAAGGLAGGLWATYGAKLERGAPFVLDALDFDDRMRAARAVVTGEGRFDATTLEGKAAGEVAVRCRQAGVPCHGICGENALSLFDQRILDLQHVVEAPTLAALEEEGERLVRDV